MKLYLRRKRLQGGDTGRTRRGTILFVHGSSVSATPVFDLQLPGKPEASTMDWFARDGFDTYCSSTLPCRRSSVTRHRRKP